MAERWNHDRLFSFLDTCPSASALCKKWRAVIYMREHGLESYVYEHYPHLKGGHNVKRRSDSDIWAAVSKCKDQREFRENYKSEYRAACRHGLMEEIKSKLKGVCYTEEQFYSIVSKCKSHSDLYERKGAVKYMIEHDLESCVYKRFPNLKPKFERSLHSNSDIWRAVAKCEYIVDFRYNYPKEYNAAHKRGLMPEIRKHLKKKRSDDLTIEKVWAIAEKYDIIDDFKHNEEQAYKYAAAHGMIPEIRARLGRKRVEWSEDKVWAIAEQCLKMSEFRIKAGSAVPFINRHNLWPALREYFNVKPYMDLETALAIVEEYEYYSDFRINEQAAYTFLRKRGLLRKYTKNLIRKGNLKHRKIYVIEFSTHAAYIGLSIDPKRRHTEHLNRDNCAVYKYIHSHDATYEFKELTDFLEADDAIIAECDTIKQYRDNGWEIINMVDGGSLGYTPILKYSLDYIISKAELCENAGDFEKKHSALYAYASRHRWLYLVTPHYKHPCIRINERSFEDILKIAMSYESFVLFRRKGYGFNIYRYAVRHGMIESIIDECVKAGVWKREDIPDNPIWNIEQR